MANHLGPFAIIQTALPTQLVHFTLQQLLSPYNLDAVYAPEPLLTTPIHIS
ncbi:hypothetical protein F0726_00522 [Acidithiobacillus caldus]|nr:hypothetical protein F0726_00522 [Acidithiobacillus caldus]